jgi:drug/metabolite transporter (DMT)-like permease
VTVYYAEQNIDSGLVAVGYSASPLLGMFGLRLFFGTPITARIAVGSLLGIAGIMLVFAPEFAHFRDAGSPGLGAVFTVLSVLFSAGGSLVAHRNYDAHVPVWQSMAWGMLYGSIFAAAWTLGNGKAFSFEASAGYVLSLLYLVVFGSILAFGAYLTLLKRVGAARSGYVGVMIPVVALFLSALFEGFRWHALTWVGIAVSLAGNVLVLRDPSEGSRRA